MVDARGFWADAKETSSRPQKAARKDVMEFELTPSRRRGARELNQRIRALPLPGRDSSQAAKNGFPGEAELLYRIACGNELHGGDAIVFQLGEFAVDVLVVDFAGPG